MNRPTETPDTSGESNSSNPLQAKLKSLDDLSDIAAKERSHGGTVVLAHGTFDLLHIGHLRHLRRARKEGSMLIVTITADAHVNKGPGRPIFSEHMRAEMLAALECVDYVGICNYPQAIEAIQAIKPNVYAKGSDYSDPKDDVTGGILLERNAVESIGGRIELTDDIVFSSSSLINRHFKVFDPTLEEFLESWRDQGRAARLAALIDKVRDYRVLMIGDAIIDDYNYVSAMGKSPKEHMIATLFGKREVFAGGVFAAANHVAGFCKEIEVVTTIGGGCEYRDLIEKSLHPNVKLHFFEQDGVPTTRKSRFIDESYLRKLFEVYFMNDTPIAPEIETRINRLIGERAKEFNLVIVTDFGHGLVTRPIIDNLCRSAKFLAVNAQSNSANLGFNLITKYPKADYVCIDAPEARLAISDRATPIRDLASKILPSRIDCSRIVVTQGKDGSVGYDAARGIAHAPAFTKTVVDTMGAGDAFFAVTAPMAAAGGDIEDIIFIGNAAGAIKVGVVGHRKSVERAPLLKYITTLLK